ncbi:hypothetical protein ACFQVA_02870 [Actinomadura keratinilytica]
MEWFAAPEYWLSRLVFQKLLALLYLVAFLATALQFRALNGSRGMTPVRESVSWAQWRHSPSLLLPRRSDRLTACCAWTGCALSAALLAAPTSCCRCGARCCCGRRRGCCTCPSSTPGASGTASGGNC